MVLTNILDVYKKYKACKNYVKHIDWWHEKLHSTLISEKVTKPYEHYSIFLKKIHGCIEKFERI